jgi:multidrug efflux pump subunit AcrA (membrane-fusion protein)
MAWAQDGPPAPVSVDEARADTFSAAFWVSGTVISRNDARIAAETDGRITWVADVGTRIDRGQPFATIDDTDLRLELSDNKAQLESLQAQKRYQENNLERLNRLAASNNAAVNQLDEAQSLLEMTIQDIRRAEVSWRIRKPRRPGRPIGGHRESRNPGTGAPHHFKLCPGRIGGIH